jgi:chromosome partitioning protein
MRETELEHFLNDGGQLRCAAFVDKGGVGKTTSIGHIGWAMAQEHDLETLIIDVAGSQNNIATLFGMSDEIEEIEAPLSAVFGDEWEFFRENIDNLLEMMVFSTDHENLDIIPADSGIEGADSNLGSVPLEERFTKLKSFVEEDLGHYDAILFDLPGREMNIALNGLAAAENVIAPIKPGEFEFNQLRKLEGQFEQFVDDLPDKADIAVSLVMILPCIVEHENVDQDFLEDVHELYPNLTSEHYIKKSADIKKAPKHGETVFQVDDSSLYNTGVDARDAYSAVTEELIDRLLQQCQTPTKP